MTLTIWLVKSSIKLLLKMVKLLVVPTKKPSSADVVKPLKNLFESASNVGSLCKSYDAITEFGNLRTLTMSKFCEKTEDSLEIIYGYFDQICSLETKVPNGELQIPFKWRCAFDKGNIFGEKTTMTQTSLFYEKICVLFNIAALQSAIAAVQSLESDIGLKIATKCLQQAAGIFECLKNLIRVNISGETTPDLQVESLKILETLMLAQAQELFIKKAIRDRLKDSVIAALCCQCEQFYTILQSAMQGSLSKVSWEKEWILMVSAKQMVYHAMMQLFQSSICRSNKRIGEEIARLKDAVNHFHNCQSLTNGFEFIEEYANRANLSLKESIKDNDFIYNEVIPDLKSLPKPGNVQLAKAIVVPFPLSKEFKDLFYDFIPVSVRQAILACEARKNEAVNSEIVKLRESTKALNELLSSLNLPAAIEMTSSTSVLPPSILNKSLDLQQKGGIQNIETLLKELPELLTRNREILDETAHMLAEEQSSDDLLRKQFKDRWNRVPSFKLNEAFKLTAGKYREIINNAIDADKVIRQNYEANKKIITLLSAPSDEIERALPSSNGKKELNEAAGLYLLNLMKKVDEVKGKKDFIEAELKLVEVDLKSEFLHSFAKDGVIDEASLSTAAIEKALNNLQKKVQNCIKEQELLEAEILEAHSEFKNITGISDDGRHKFLSELASGYDSFVQLESNLKEGIKFYNDLTQLLVVFQNKVSDFCFARKTEKEELMKDLTKELSKPMLDKPTSDPLKGSSGSPPTLGQPEVLPYPLNISSIPIPLGTNIAIPYPTYVAPPMPSGFNPYATLPYPSASYNYPGVPHNPKPGES